MDMALMLERVKRTPEYSQLIGRVGEAEANRLVTAKIVSDFGRGILTFYPALVAAVATMGLASPYIVPAVTAVRATTGLTGSATAALANSARLNVGQTLPGAANVGYYTRAAGGLPFSPVKYQLLQFLGSLGFGFGFVAGERIGWEAMDAALQTDQQETFDKFKTQIMSLAKKSDSELMQLGFDSEEIANIRRAYAEILNELSGTDTFNDSLPGGTVSNEMPSAISDWISFYRNLVQKGHNPHDAVTSTVNAFGWKLDDATLNPILTADLAYYQQQQTPSPADTLTEWLSLYGRLRSAGLSDSDAYNQATNTLGYSPPGFPAPVDSIPTNLEEYGEWINMYQEFRREGLSGDSAVSAATEAVGFSPPQDVVADIIAQDFAEDEIERVQNVSVPSAGDLVNAFEESLYINSSEGDSQNEWMQDEKYLAQFEGNGFEPSGGDGETGEYDHQDFVVPDMDSESYTGAAPPGMRAKGYSGYRQQPTMNGESNMPQPRKGRDGIWRWPSGAPINGAKPRYGGRRSYGRSRYRSRY